MRTGGQWTNAPLFGRRLAEDGPSRNRAVRGRRAFCPEVVCREEAAEARRSPRRTAFAGDLRIARSVTECACPLALPHRRITAALQPDDLARHGLWVHRETVPVHEVFHGKTLWQGDVEVFDLTGHPKAKRCYGWTHSDPEEFITILELPRWIQHKAPSRSALRIRSKRPDQDDVKSAEYIRRQVETPDKPLKNALLQIPAFVIRNRVRALLAVNIVVSNHSMRTLAAILKATKPWIVCPQNPNYIIRFLWFRHTPILST
jgi:hypothetical protein